LKTSKTKTKATLIALFLVFTVVASLVAWLPTVNAAVNYYNSYVYIAVGRSVIGVNQAMPIVMWTADVPPDIGEQTTSGRQAWYNIVFNVTKPDGSVETFTIEKTDPVGGGYISFTPEAVGTYYVQCFFPEAWKNTTTTQNFYSAAASTKVSFIAVEEQVQLWAESPLPDGYWTRPINSANRDWYVLGGNWLSGAHEQPAGAAGGTSSRLVGGEGTESAHILWAKPYYVGGMNEENFGDIGLQTGHYQGMSWSAIVINGKMYYTPRSNAHGTEGILCVDLYTGETLSFTNQTMPSFGQIYNYDSGNQHGTYAYLWRTSGVTLPEIVQVPNAEPYADVKKLPKRITAVQTINRTATPLGTASGTSTWELIDAYTLKTVCYIANVTSGGTAVYGKDGSILRYNTVNLGTSSNPNYYLQVWNSSHGTMVSSEIGTGSWQWRPSGGTFGGANAYLGGLAYNYVHDGRDFFTLNVSIPSILGPRNALLNETGSIRAVREGEFVIIGTAGRNNELGIVPGWMMAVSLKPGQEGAKLWDVTFTPPSSAGNATMSLTGVYPEYDVILYESSKLLKRWGISLTTGQLLWESESEPDMNYYSMQDNVYEGKLITTGYGGVVLAYDITTGDIVWNYTATTVGFESPYGNYPINIFALCDGKIYTLTGEHSITQPMWRGPNIRCINASNGVELWKIMGFGANGGAHLTGMYMQMADGMVLGLNYFDNKIYCFGKGDSKVTISAPQMVPALGSSVMLTGTVTDDTPTGSFNTNDKLDVVLRGTPAVSDASMEDWMEYLFMQQAMPTNATGVEVTLDTLDPNGNFIHIGTVTSDITGAYGCLFTPEVPGTYQIIATFAGSAAYGSSYAQTYMAVGEAAASPAPIEFPQPFDYTMHFVVVAIAVILAIVIVGILLLRKK